MFIKAENPIADEKQVAYGAINGERGLQAQSIRE